MVVRPDGAAREQRDWRTAGVSQGNRLGPLTLMFRFYRAAALSFLVDGEESGGEERDAFYTHTYTHTGIPRKTHSQRLGLVHSGAQKSNRKY